MKHSFPVFMCLIHVYILTETASGSSSWWGHSCCEWSLNPKCKRSCKKAKSREDLGEACSVDQDLYLLGCLDRSDASQNCCSSTGSSQCRSSCLAIFSDDSPTPARQKRVRDHCSSQVSTCVQNYTKSVPVRNMLDSISCCQQSDVLDTCQSKCREALTTLKTEDEVVYEIMRHCGEPNPSAPLWQCFLRSHSNHIRHQYTFKNKFDVTLMDSLRLMCCGKAVAATCKRLCSELYSKRPFETTDEFDQKCLLSLQEKDLNICLEEVENQCQPGCSNLSFCTNFNDRPTQSFRSCNSQSDKAAKQAIQFWEKDEVSVPAYFGFNIPILNIKECEPQKWKAIACTLYIKPCHHTLQSRSICRSDCKDVLSKCLDKSKMHQTGVTIDTICAKLSPQEETDPCISLSLYTDGVNQNTNHDRVMTPCNPNPCNKSQACVVRWDKCLPTSERNCQSYQCLPGCLFGDGATQVIPRNSYVRIPDGPNTDCFHACRCGQNGLFHHCKQMDCVSPAPCNMPSGMIQSHGSVFMRGCSRCACHASKVICSNRSCGSGGHSAANDQRTVHQKVLPCACIDQYLPVCGMNGQTYASACLASCAGLNSTEILPGGQCSSRNPCSKTSCPNDERCVAKRQQCIGPRNADCKQFECVKLKENCEDTNSPVCDTNVKDIASVCQMLLWKRTLAYRGRCLFQCSKDGPVCGLNGDDYSSECAAWASGVTVDYSGPCRAVGYYQDSQTASPSCTNVTCDNHRSINCDPIFPPGSCCPICAGEIRLLMSPVLSDLAAQTLSGGVITVEQVLNAVRLHIKVLYCEVFGYMNVEGDIVLLLAPIAESPTAALIEACMTEMERIGFLVSSSSPTTSMFVPLSFFVTADVRTSKVRPTSLRSSSVQNLRPSSSFFSSCIVVFVVFSFFLRRSCGSLSISL